MRSKEVNNGNTLRYEFDDWSDFVDFANQTPKLKHGGEVASRGTDSHYVTFTKTASFEAALQLAKEGWPEGVKLADKFSRGFIEKLGHQIERLDPIADMEGVGIDIGAFVSGEPECWLRYETTLAEGSGKVIRMLYSASATSAISAESMIRKGAIAAALIQLLEMAGIRVELYVLPFCSKGTGYGARNYSAEQLVKIKDAEQPLDLNRMIFAIAHPSTMRRLGFSVCEQYSAVWQERMGTGFGYGHSDKPSKDLVDSADIWLTSMNTSGEEPYWESADATEAWIIKQLQKQGVSIEKV